MEPQCKEFRFNKKKKYEKWDPDQETYKAYQITHLEGKKYTLQGKIYEARESWDEDAYDKYKSRLEEVNHELLHLQTELGEYDARDGVMELQPGISPTLSVSEVAPSSILRPPNSFIEPQRPPRWVSSNFTPDAWKRILQSPSWQREMEKQRMRAAAARKEAEDKFAQSIAKSAAEAERRAATISAEESIHLAVLDHYVKKQLKMKDSFLPDI